MISLHHGMKRSKNYILLSIILSNDIKFCHSHTISNPTKTYYYTCRHKYEDKLIEELNLSEKKSQIINSRSLWGSQSWVDSERSDKLFLLKASSPCPGLVKAEYKDITSTELDDGIKYRPQDPIYALQVLPNAKSAQGKTIRELSSNTISILGLNDIKHSSTAQELLKSPKASLSIHAFVPDMLKGNPNPKMMKRAHTIANEIISNLQKVYPCSRHRSSTDSNRIKWILQLLLISSNEMIVSLSPIHSISSSTYFSQMTWPCSTMTCGLANVEDELFFKYHDTMAHDCNSITTPSSAYRKLLEAFCCIGCIPHPKNGVSIDLGASPGGWVSMLYKLGYKVLAVDRSELDLSLMKQESILFQSGDAFAYKPPNGTNIILLVSDVISYPDRIVDLLQTWCEAKWTDCLIVTMKFKDSDTPSSYSWDYICNAVRVIEANGYVCRIKHFFNNKNEVMFLVAKRDCDEISLSRDDDEVLHSDYLKLSPISMFPILLPKSR